jgi:hypothetical protein
MHHTIMTHQSSDHANVVQNRRKRKIRPEDTEVILDGNDYYENDELECNDTNVCDESDTADADMNAVIDIGSNSCSDDTTTDDDDDDDASGILWLQHQSTASSSPLPATMAFTINEHIMIQYFQTAIQSHDDTEAQFLNLDDSVVTTSASPRYCTTNNGSSDGGTNNNNVLSNSTHKEQQQQQPNDHAVQLWTPNELDLPLWAVMASTMAPLSKMPGSL